MPPTPDGEPAGRRRHRHRCRPRNSSASARTPRRGRSAATPALVRGRAFSPRLTALWPYAGADPLPGTALLAGWLGRTIVTLATTYTRPGDRVLLLSPPSLPRPQSPTHRGLRAPDPYAGLTEAVWTVIRLGRGVDTATAAPVPDYPDTSTHPPDGHRAGSGSGPRPGPRWQPNRQEPERRTAHAIHEPDGRFDLIVTAVHPHDTDWPAHTDWTALLAATGAIAAITHSDRRLARWLDPVATVVNTFRSRGLRWHDHIAVLTQLLPEPAQHVDNPPRTLVATTARAAALNSEPPLIRTVHHDLLLITPAKPGTSDRHGETSDE